MKNTSLISSETAPTPLQNGQRFSNNTGILLVKQQEENGVPTQTIRQKQVKEASSQQEAEVVKNWLLSSQQEAEVVPQIIYGRILEIKRNIVTLRCLMVEDEQVFEIMSFDKKIVKKTVNLVINQLVEIKIYKSQGEVKYTLANSNRQDLTEKFKPKDYFSEFAGSILFQPLPLHINADNF